MTELDQLRREIDVIDGELIRLLGRRFAVCRRVAEYKRRHDIEMLQPDRADHVAERCDVLAQQELVSADFVRELYTLILGESCRVQDHVIHACDHDGERLR